MAIALLSLAAFGTVLLAWVDALGYRIPGNPALIRHHFVTALVTTTILVMAHSFIMFFLIATGAEMKEIEKSKGWGDSLRSRLIALKNEAFPAMSTALLLVMANFILGAAAHTRAIPGWAHGLVGLLTLLTCLLALYREYRVLGENNRLIAEVAERRRRADAAAPPSTP